MLCIDAALDYERRNGSRDGAGPNTTYIYITNTFNTCGAHSIAKGLYYKGADFQHSEMNPVEIEVYIIKVESVTSDKDYCWSDGSFVTFTAIPDPPTAEFPAGCPTWTASAGSFVTPASGTIVVWAPPIGAGGTATIQATCGTSSANKDVMHAHVYGVTDEASLLRSESESLVAFYDPPAAPISAIGDSASALVETVWDTPVGGVIEGTANNLIAVLDPVAHMVGNNGVVDGVVRFFLPGEWVEKVTSQKFNVEKKWSDWRNNFVSIRQALKVEELVEQAKAATKAKATEYMLDNIGSLMLADAAASGLDEAVSPLYHQSYTYALQNMSTPECFINESDDVIVDKNFSFVFGGFNWDPQAELIPTPTFNDWIGLALEQGGWAEKHFEFIGVQMGATSIFPEDHILRYLTWRVKLGNRKVGSVLEAYILMDVHFWKE